jgi:V/A-type H+-transporting ATPase subunit D
MNPNDYPTKHNLLEARKGLRLATQGFDLMDKKHQVLLVELRLAKINFFAICEKVGHILEKTYKALETAYTEMGRSAVEDIRNEGYYALAGTTASLDEAYFSWREAKQILVEFAKADANIRRLQKNIRKAQKKAAALGNITIPTYEARIRYIQSQLEERGRDELVRLKIIKAQRN